MARIMMIMGSEAGQAIGDTLQAAGHQVTRAASVAEAASAGGDVIIAAPEQFAAEAAPADMPVIVVATPESAADAVAAVRAGAFDLVHATTAADEVELKIDRAQRWQNLVRENESLRQQLGHPAGADPLAPAKELAGKPLADIEKQVILSTLEQFKGHRLRTAAALGIGVRTLGMKIKRWREEGEPIAGRQNRSAIHVNIS
jgi:DNA-binding NtrC family response regulator